MQKQLRKLFSISRDEELIEFNPVYEGFSTTHPLPMSKVVPSYFKEAPQRCGDLPNDLTYKTCPSFVDAFTVGYVLRCPVDVHITCYEEHFEWLLPHDVPPVVVTSHSGSQMLADTQHSIVDESQFYPYMLKIDTGYLLKHSENVGIQLLPFYYDKENRSNFEACYGYFDNLLNDRHGTCPINLFVRRRPEHDNSFLIKKGSPICTIVPYRYTNFKLKIGEAATERFNKIRNEGLGVANRGKFFANSIQAHRVKKRFL